MSILVHIHYTGQNDNAESFANEMISSGVVNKIRAERGNIRYDYYYPREDKETVLLIDEWESQQAIDEHHDSPMMQDIMRLREKYNLSMKVERYVTDDGGIPEKDKSFIK